jgi:hypothetical protein
VLVYVAAAALIYAFLDPTFPGGEAVAVLLVAFLSIATATALAAAPGRLYARRQPGLRGRIRVVPWTLFIAVACVIVTRLIAVEPGYVYGIIGAFAIAGTLTLVDQGRMAARSAIVLLALALAAWLLRVPLEPEPGIPLGPEARLVNAILVALFVVGVEGVVFGLIPLAFLPGDPLFRWSRWRWVLLWALGVALFAHVIVYPVTDYRPDPRPASLITVVITVAVYGAIALGTWAFFRWYAARRQRPGILTVTGGAGPQPVEEGPSGAEPLHKAKGPPAAEPHNEAEPRPAAEPHNEAEPRPRTERHPER